MILADKVVKNNQFNKNLLPIAFFYMFRFCSSNLFGYKSMFFHYSFIGFTCFLLMYLVLYKIHVARTIKIPTIFFLASAFVNLALPLVIYLLTSSYELYSVHYYITFFILIILLIVCIINNIISRETISNTIIVFAFVEAFYCILQFICTVNTNYHFKVTGSNPNPNSTSLFMVMCVPLIIKQISGKKLKERFVMILGLFMIFFSILLLKCRSAYLGLFLIFFLTCIRNYKINKQKWCLITAIILLFTSIIMSPAIYNFKRASADGRLYVWNVSIDKILKQPWGYGYGMIQGTYNEAQSLQFQYSQTTEKDKLNAEYMNTLNNDYLEIMMQGGIFGFVFFYSFLALFVYWGWNSRKFYETLGVCLFLIMSLFSFAFSAPQIAFILAIYLSLIDVPSRLITITKLLKYSLVVISVNLVLFTAQRIYFQIKVRQMSNLVRNNNIGEAEKLAGEKLLFNSTSEYYNRTIADIHYAKKNFKIASIYYHNAIKYAPFQDVLSRLAYCYFMLGDVENAERYLRYSAYIQPSNFSHYFELMIFYYQSNQTSKSKMIAHCILSKKIKYKTRRVLEYKCIAKKILMSNKIN